MIDSAYRFYVAGGSDERLTIVRPLIDKIKEAGAVITHDWTYCEGYEGTTTNEDKVAFALADIEGVDKSDIVWVIVPENKSEGAGTETGAAIALGKYVIVSGPNAHRNIFSRLANQTYWSHEEALAWIISLIKLKKELDQCQAKE